MSMYLALSNRRFLNSDTNILIQDKDDIDFQDYIVVPYILGDIVLTIDGLEYFRTRSFQFNTIKINGVCDELTVDVLKKQYILRYRKLDEGFAIEFFDSNRTHQIRVVRILYDYDKNSLYRRLTSTNQVNVQFDFGRQYLCYGLTFNKLNIWYKNENLGKYHCFMLGLTFIVLDKNYNAIAYCIAKQYDNQGIKVLEILICSDYRFVKAKILE